jgi:thiamine biosynthesis lipoprotein
MNRWFCISALAALAAACSSPDPSSPRSTSGTAQGTTYSVQWWSTDPFDEAAFTAAIGTELERLDALLSNYRADSVIERFNEARTTEPLALPAELVALLRVAAEVHSASAGCFDPTVRPLVALWGLDGETPHVPQAAAIAATLERVGLGELEVVDDTTVRKTVPDLELDLSSIGQGYTVARLSEIAHRFGLEHYLVELGGEIAGRGHKPDGSPWRVGVEEPVPADPAAPSPIRQRLTLPVRPATVITSGTYRHFFLADGRRYSHIIDPRTGTPVTHDLVSVTVIHDSATLGAAWATALLCLGPEAAAATAEREDIAALLFAQDGNLVAEQRTSALLRNWPGMLD